MEIHLQTLYHGIGAVMATRSDIPLFHRCFAPCLLPILPLPWILRWCSVLSLEASHSSGAKSTTAFLVVRSGRRLGSFQLKATLYCSKSHVFDYVGWEAAGHPATARGSGSLTGATLGGLMQGRENSCASTLTRSESHRKPAALRPVVSLAMLCLLVLSCAALVSAQVNTATLSGTVVDPQGLPVKGAKVTMTHAGTGAQRTALSDDNGSYNLVGLTPGQYKMNVDGGANFSVYQNASIVLTVGESATFDLHLDLRGMQQTVTVSTETAPIETTKTEVSQTVEQRRIDNLPINGRNYINFTLTNSQTTRDVSPTIGPAPNSGLNVSGARARSNMVSIDGVDAVDNSINGIRSTVSQEAVQEFQLILSNYNAEYGRATGGVVNIVTKGGGNEFHGNAFGYFRNKSFQARNAFSGAVDSNGVLQPTKQAYTRTQSGLTFGGPLKKDKTFFFFSYEYTQREETGFSSIGIGNFGLTTGLVPCIPIPLSLTGGANGQLAFYQASLGALTGNGAACTNANPAIQAQISGLEKAAVVTGAGSNVALNG